MLVTDPVLTVEEAAQICVVTHGSLRKWLHRERDPLPSLRAGTSIVILPQALADWAAAEGRLLACDPHQVAKPWPRDAAVDPVHGGE
jgi:hypothetical protein